MLRSNFLKSALAMVAAATFGIAGLAGASTTAADAHSCCCGDNCKCENCGCNEGKCENCGCEEGGCTDCKCADCGCGSDCCSK